MLGFMFRHGHYTDACMLFFPPDGIPPQPLSLPLASPSSSTQRMDPLATDYGTIDELCDLCVGYGAMGILEDIISARVSMTASQDSTVSQYTASALARICLYCETHRLFNFLYRFQGLSANQRTFHGQSVAINVSTIERNTESPTRGVNTKPRSRNTRTTCQNFSHGPLLKTANAPPISRTLRLTTTTSNPQTTATNNTDLGYNASFHARGSAETMKSRDREAFNADKGVR
ncbi:hypothetical protein QJS10_CPB14g00989 [Acorus calamus]|uniref:Uncharacterized protein n=1 Tax=Acorus calamus TaxID=4465 RepID=A0AAV9DF35_ACOCL|nr:hypothetical protein QJS10_CPB14g00989 [Acorus calamus]